MSWLSFVLVVELQLSQFSWFSIRIIVLAFFAFFTFGWRGFSTIVFLRLFSCSCFLLCSRSLGLRQLTGVCVSSRLTSWRLGLLILQLKDRFPIS